MKNKVLNDVMSGKMEEIEIKKYTSSEVEEIIKKANHRKKINYIKLVTAFTFLLIVSIGAIKFSMYKLSIERANTEEKIFEEERNYANTVILDVKDNYDKVDAVPLVMIVKINEVKDNKIVENIPNTKIEADVQRLISGTYNDNTIEFNINQCVAKISELDIDFVKNFKLNEKFDSNSDIRIVSNKAVANLPFPQKGKTYIICLKLKNSKYYIDNTSVYPFFEYDLKNNLVNINKKWEKANLYLLLNS